MRAVRVASETNPLLGHWRLIAHPGVPGSSGSIDITTLRGIPTVPETMSFSDPFGPEKASFTFPQISYFDRRNAGDLWWLNPFTTFELVWTGSLPVNYPYGRINVHGDPTTWWHPRKVSVTPAFSWLGRATSFGYSDDGLTLDFQGAYYQLDDWLAKPEYPYQPMPYEWAIARQFLDRPALRIKPMTIIWPDWWSRTFTPPPKGTPQYLIPSHVHKDRNWTGLVTRNTGKWDVAGTSYIQAMLTALYTRRGRWTIDIFEGGMPVLLHRDIRRIPADDMVVIDMAGTNKLSFDEDWLQSLSAVFAQGQSLAGVSYSGMQVSPSGTITRYEPMASLRQVHPETHRHNEWFEPKRARREVMLQLEDGLSELDAQEVALAHLERFSEPGQTGTCVLNEDPTIGGETVPRMLVRAGMTVRYPGVLGTKDGLIAHVTNNTVDFKEETNTLTFDSKFRDALTVKQVRMRGRDALQVARTMVVGQYTPPIPDQLVPWNYDEGSGYIPGAMPGGTATSLRLFDEMPEDTEFPWESWTVAHPPSNPRWRKSYVRIGPAKANADKNWAWVAGSAKGGRYGIPIRMSQAGDIRLLQVAAYDSDGHVLAVPFHISFYLNRGVNVNSMPNVPANSSGDSDYPPHSPKQHYPFVKGGWERFNADGTQTNPQILQPTQTALLVRGYGDFYERAGFWPGSDGRGDPATGLLVDETVWHYDTTQQGPNVFDPYSLKQPKFRGMMYAMIYCEAQGDTPVFFLGRMFRAEPGQQT